ncbi:Hsp33 family molecular chaperone HslO [Myxococcota bacterium]|nr:Hsp33 family molecular chaperone HslO [Myxococcota bacterium]
MIGHVVMEKGAPGTMLRGLTLQGSARLVLVLLEGPGREMIQRHGLSGDAARVLAEGLVMTALLGAHIKGTERLFVQVQADAPKFAFLGEVTGEGGVRARVVPDVLTLTGPIEGVLQAVKWDGPQELYRGLSPIEQGSFEGALSSYFTRSQQTSGVVRLGVTFGEDGSLQQAAGLLIERLGGDEASLEDFQAAVEPLKTASMDSLVVGALSEELLGGVEVLAHTSLLFACTCSMERVESTLAALGAADLRALAAEQGGTEVDCHFCSTQYRVSGERLIELAAGIEASMAEVS